MGLLETLEEQAAEQAREHPHRQEEARPASDPAAAIEGDAAGRHDAVDMRVVVEGLAPAVQHGDDADPRPEVLGIGGDRGQGLGRGLEQEAVDPGLVLVGDSAERRRQGEHHVEVGHRQQLGLARLQPGLGRRPLALGAVPVAARVVGDAGVGAVGALLDMAAQLRRAAELDRAHDAPLGEAEMPRVGGAPGGPEAAEDVRHLELRPGHAAGSGRWRPPRSSSSSGLFTCRIVCRATRA